MKCIIIYKFKKLLIYLVIKKNLTYLNTFTFLTVYYVHLPYTLGKF